MVSSTLTKVLVGHILLLNQLQFENAVAENISANDSEPIMIIAYFESRLIID